MGYLKEQFGWTLIGVTPAGTCPVCAVKHNPEMPHNRDSLTYQYKFFDEHGRWPTWKDAMAHCDEHIKELWTASLIAHGQKID